MISLSSYSDASTNRGGVQEPIFSKGLSNSFTKETRWLVIDRLYSIIVVSLRRLHELVVFTWPPTPSPRFHWGTTSYLLLDTYVIRNTQNDGTILDVLTVCMNTQICTLVYMIPTIPSLQIGAACCLASIYLASLHPSIRSAVRQSIY